MILTQSKLAAVVVAALTATSFAASAEASMVLLSLGDSITFGEDSTQLGAAPNTSEYQGYVDQHYDGTGANYSSAYNSTYWTSRGYRVYLQDRLNTASQTYDFIGNRKSGHGTMDVDHWGNPGGHLASSSVVGGDFSRPNTSMADALRNITRNTFTIGSNNYNVSDKNHGQVAFNPALAKPTHVLLHGGTNDLSGGTAISGFDTLLGVMLEQHLAGSFDADAQFFIAKIIPKHNALAGTTTYNNHIESRINQWATTGTANQQAFADRVTIVDMATIALAQLDLAWLGGLFGQTEGQIAAKLDLTSDGYVNWFNGSSANLNVMDSDGTHPNDLGYAVMANVWHTAIPEPAAAVLLIIGTAVAATRRRAA